MTPAKAPLETPPPVTALALRPTLLPASTGPDAYPDDPTWLADELAWIELRIHRISLASKLARRPGAAKAISKALARRLDAENTLRVHIDARLAASPPRALDRLCARLDLDDFERMVLLLAAAPCFSRKFESTFALLDRDGVQGTLTVEVAFNFAELPFAERLARRHTFTPQGRLIQHDLVVVDLGSRQIAPRDLLAAEVELTSRAFSWMIGNEGALGELTAFSSVEQPLADLDAVVLPPADRRQLLAAIDHHDAFQKRRMDWGVDAVIRYGRGLMMLFHGPPGTGKTMTAHGVARRMGKKLLNVDVPTFLAHEDAGRFLPGLFREARLQDAVLFFDECETLMRSRASGNLLMSLLLTELERFEGVAVLATNQPAELDEALTRRILVRLRFSPPDESARQHIWRLHLPHTIPQADDVDPAALAARHPLTGGLIKNAVLSAIAHTLFDDDLVLHQHHLIEAADAQLHRPTDAVVDHPQARLDALVLPDALRAHVHGLLRAARGGLAGVVAVEGPLGSGRTATITAIASELGWPMLSASPETLLERLEQAGHQRAVLRLEDLHHTTLTSEHIRLLAASRALVFIECERIEHLDDRLRGRLQLRLSLPRPDAAARRALWSRLLPSDTADIGSLAAHALTGGQMVQVIVSLRATDTPLTTAALMQAIDRLSGRVGF